MKFKIFQPQAIHEIGQRKNQEDTIFPAKGVATTDNRLFMVCDGMGGHEHGEVASGILCKAVSDFFAEDTYGFVSDIDVKDALNKAYEQLDQHDDGAARKMGTTFTFVALHSGGVTIAHIGDSRIYHVRPSEHIILYKSRDHSLVYDLYQAGEISFDEMSTSPQKNVITRAVMPGEDNRTKPDIVHSTNIKPGDYFYLCSDGMLEQISDQEILDILCSRGSDEDKCRKLIENSRNNKDNHSAYLIHIEDVESEPNDATQPNNEATANCNAVNIDPKPGDYKDDDGVKMVNWDPPFDDPTSPNSPAPVQNPPTPVQTPQNNPPAVKPQPKFKKMLPIIIAALAVILILPIWLFRGGDSNNEDNKLDDSTEAIINSANVDATEEQVPSIQEEIDEDVSSSANKDAIRNESEGTTEEKSNYKIVRELEKAKGELTRTENEVRKFEKDIETFNNANTQNQTELKKEIEKAQKALENAKNKRDEAKQKVKELREKLNNSD